MSPRLRFLVAAAVVLAAVIVAAASLKAWLGAKGRPIATSAAAPRGERLPSLDDAFGWLNGTPLTLDSLAGHPVVLAVWSDTDPRCLDALPRVESWQQAYAGYGVRVVGVYIPEFSFGADSSVPARLARRLGLSFEIALDPGYQIRGQLDGVGERGGIVVADEHGRIALAAGYDRLNAVDRAIRAQVRRLHPELGFPREPEPAAGVEPAVSEPRFVYLGAGRIEAGPLAHTRSGRTLTFTAEFRYQEEGGPYLPYPVGRWTPSAEGLTAARGGPADFVAIRYPGGRVGAVLSPPPSGRARVWVMADEGWLPEETRGDDVRLDDRGASYVDVTEPRLYWIARGKAGHLLRFSPEEPGLTIHSLTFEAVARGGD